MNRFFNGQNGKQDDLFGGKPQANSMETKEVDGVFESTGESMGLAQFYNRIYSLVAMGVGLSAVISLLTLYVFPGNIRALLMSPGVMFGLLAAELILVFALGRKSLKNASSSLPLFFAYSGINGITLSVIVSFYAPKLVTATFFIAMAMFLGLSLFGRVTNRDLSALGKACFAGLFGLLALLFVNFFIGGSGLALLISVGMIVVFSGLIVYDNNQIKKYYEYVNGNVTQGMVVSAALNLYLDFVNLFIYLLRLLSYFTSDD